MLLGINQLCVSFSKRIQSLCAREILPLALLRVHSLAHDVTVHQDTGLIAGTGHSRVRELGLLFCPDGDAFISQNNAAQHYAWKM